MNIRCVIKSHFKREENPFFVDGRKVKRVTPIVLMLIEVKN